eukprot:CAMPEP_0117679166 /NCGR_PEP_ID=MMETSP0804-20121206/17675_1 /TAXON_ID=1074897 /ORGANISM="Tetraselmis astigmatica, Strain CCMP880" /LENGTH=1066 /DNA_ID=CAMNT_0005488581 /DNA_START=94 /DNA_END=3295 /DNA_ORIENTATION=-
MSPSALPASGLASQGHPYQLPQTSVATSVTQSEAANASGDTANSTNGNQAPAAPTFQEAVQRLQNYWASVGCAVWLPHNTEVGAGTMNPATFLRVLGPEPWNVCYAEPSVRPDDSRYGDNPNRVQRHTQYQVILKPDPGNPQELYLGSLEALGIVTHAHDVRFVEDNWESPVLGAWGLGWEVWLDGMEVTQFTYFQQAGGQALAVPAVEITYGLERILMALQGVNHFKDIRYNDSVTYGEMFLQNEYEMSVYNLDEADVAGQRARFDLFVAEATAMLEKRLPVPAYDHLLKTSHAFNILDARGAIGVTERAKCFGDMRALARRVTQLWTERREEQGYPLGTVQLPGDAATGAVDPSLMPQKGTAAPFVLEIGCEELPPDDLDSVLDALQSSVPELLKELNLSYERLKVEGTPRRLAVMVEGLAAYQEDVEQRLRGPPAKAAFKDGEPTKALLGFAKKNGVDVDAVILEADVKGVEYCFAEVRSEGRSAAEVLAEHLGNFIAGLAFTKSMRWNGSLAFSRPVRWLLALHGACVVPVAMGPLAAGATTRLLRGAISPEQQVASAADYRATLEAGAIVLDGELRRVDMGLRIKAAEGIGGAVPAATKDGLLAEVANLVESPTVVLGAFEERFLSLPRELLVMVMRKHQRYFPVVVPGATAAGGEQPAEAAELMPHFITVANGPVDPAVVAAGNEAVLRARFEDAVFFYDTDLRRGLEAMKPSLAGTMFQKDLGTLLDKTGRVEALVEPLSRLMAEGGMAEALPAAKRAAGLCKADLASSTVMEMTALAGIMGRHYAEKAGEAPEVCTAVFESVLPRNAGDVLPETHAGVIVSVADRLDSLVGLVAAGCAPTANTDPYALRRTAYAMLQTLVGNSVSLDLQAAAKEAAALQPLDVPEEAITKALEFVARRLEQLLVDRGVGVEAVRASLKSRGNNPAMAATTATDLDRELRAGEESLLPAVMTTLARPIRIIRGKEVPAEAAVDPALFQESEEGVLWEAYCTAKDGVTPAMQVAEFLKAVVPLAAPVDAFFDKVFVMAEDEAVRTNRLSLLLKVASLQDGIVDLSCLPGF